MEVRHTYERLWNGIAVDASETDMARLRESHEVAAVYPVVPVEAPEPREATEPALESALSMTGADVVQSELGFDGSGLRVGVIDTGIDYDHPDFGGAGADGGTDFPSERVPHGYDFVGDDFNADPSSPAYQPEPQPDDDPDDCQGHGTHVAGIVGADGDPQADEAGVIGVAPGAELGAYRVFGCEGSTTSDIILAALERAHADGMDVVNMSLGAAFTTWPQYPTAAASDALADEGVVVVASIGNSGAAGTWSAGAPGVGEDVIGVASFDNTHFSARTFTVSPDDEAIPYGAATGAPEPPEEGSLPMSRTGTPEVDDDACDTAGELPDLTGTAALIRRGECFFYEKAINAQNAGAEAVVMYNNVPGSFSPTVQPPSADDPPVEIPVVAIGQAEGHELDSRIAGDGTTLTWTDETLVVENPTGGLISSFSSYGMTADLQLKPDIGAPGGLIRSTYPLEQDTYAVLSGTSMSGPHVAGAVALLLEARPDLDPAQVRDLLQNYATPADWSLVPDEGYIEPVHRQGAGMLGIDTAIQGEVSIAPGKLSLGDSAGGPVTETLDIRNDGESDVTYELSHTDAITTADVFVPGFFLGGSSVDFGADTLTVPAGETAELEVTVTAPEGPEHGQYGGYLVLTPEDGDPLRVPFAGMVGEYQDVTVLADAGADLPELAGVTACDRFVGLDCTKDAEYELLPDGATFDMTGPDDMPAILVNREYPAENLKLELFRARPDGSAGPPFAGRYNTVLSLDHLGRSSGPAAFDAYVWDGTRPVGRRGMSVDVPDGEYVLRLSVLKPMGDPDNPDHVETWDSPVITIDRDG
ncbi:peptidase S8 [Actinobacteria bacterium YIM 96077]|nr:peptidase S8 [Actinobacteria bacterium YIM 96077]